MIELPMKNGGHQLVYEYRHNKSQHGNCYLRSVVVGTMLMEVSVETVDDDPDEVAETLKVTLTSPLSGEEITHFTYPACNPIVMYTVAHDVMKELLNNNVINNSTELKFLAGNTMVAKQKHLWNPKWMTPPKVKEAVARRINGKQCVLKLFVKRHVIPALRQV